MTELVRRAVGLLRRQGPVPLPSRRELLESTSGVWREGDAREYQSGSRDDWR